MKITSIVCATIMALLGTSLAEQITEANPKDETAIAAKDAARKRFADFQNQLQAIGMKKDHEGALGLVDKTLKEGGFGKDETQQIMLIRAAIFAEQGKFDEALKAADEAKTFNPEGKIVAFIDNFRTKVEAAKSKPVEKPAETGGQEKN